MDTGEYRTCDIKRDGESDVFKEVFNKSTVENKPCEIGKLSEGEKYNDSRNEQLVIHHMTASIENEQHDDEICGAIDLKTENIDFMDLPMNELKAEKIKSEDDIDIYYENIKAEIVDENSGKWELCDVCNDSVAGGTNFLTEFTRDCYCEQSTIIQGEVMLQEIKLSSLIRTTDFDSHLLNIPGKIITGKESTNEQASTTILQCKEKAPTTNLIENNIQMIDMAERQFVCEINPKSFGRVKGQETDQTIRKPFHCKNCSKAFASSSNLRRHGRIHTEKLFHCKICSKAFTHSSGLKDHERIHTGGRPYDCKICFKAFTILSNLKRHEKIHTGSKTFHCKICSKAFTQSGGLKVHERIHTGEKPYVCRNCSRTFANSSNLKHHERSHTGEKRYNCKNCSKAFASSSNLKNHERIHTGEKPFHCKSCSKAFTQSGHLKNHEKTHTEESPFLCKICSKGFDVLSDLKKHERIHQRRP